MSKQLAISSALSVLLMAGFALSDGQMATVPYSGELPVSGTEISVPATAFGALG